ncbi:MAG: hypothetical protein RIT03_100 [Bacteroidota bacterium]
MIGLYTMTPARVGTENDWVKIFANNENSYAIKSDGSLWGTGWVTEYYDGPANYHDISHFIRIGTDNNWDYVSSNMGTVALKTDGTLWGWGRNNYGMLNLGIVNIQATPIQISSETNWVKVIACYGYTLAIKTNGTLWACGLNTNGQLGDGTQTNRYNFVQIGTDTDWVDISTNHDATSLALKANGTLWGWGFNRNPALSYAMFGTTLPNNILQPTQVVGVTNCVKVDGSGYSYFVMKNDGSIWMSSLASSLSKLGNDNDWASFQLGHRFYSSSSPHLFALKNNGTLWGCGNDRFGQLGDGLQGLQYDTFRPFQQLNCSGFLAVDAFTESKLFKIYPNPTAAVLTIQNDGNLPIQHIAIIDQLGKIVLEQSNDFTTVNLASLQNGLYMLQIATDTEKLVYKVVKR